MKCPHCLGELKKQPEYLSWDYDCLKCGRGWQIQKDGSWLALFDAGCHGYSKEDVEKAQVWKDSA